KTGARSDLVPAGPGSCEGWPGHGNGPEAGDRGQAAEASPAPRFANACYAGLSLNFSVARVSSAIMPGSVIACPLSGTTRYSASGHAWWRSQAIEIGVQRS